VSVEVIATAAGLVIETDGEVRRVREAASIDDLFVAADADRLLSEWFATAVPVEVPADEEVLAPIAHQEVWAAGVTYLRSRTARMTESESAGGAAFYDLVYEAERPELFLKATPHRVVGPGATVRIRRDSTWNVPEPELTLAVSRSGQVFGCTVGNDMSSRSIEGENPLYVPQAKVYSACAAIGPRLIVGDLPDPSTIISMTIHRDREVVFEGQTSLAQMKRDLVELAAWLYRDNEFPYGAYLMTGTGIVPDDDFTLAVDDEIRIGIEGVGLLVNHVG
jgi:2-dehydro-3-deoxy-D-arabinonate dehydratase